MGRPFHSELEVLGETYNWALRLDVAPIVNTLKPLWAHPLTTIGSGGSLSSAHLAASLHRNRTRRLATVCTPLEFVSSHQSDTAAGVLIMSAGGRNPDVLSALWHGMRAEPPWIAVICGSRGTPLGKLAAANEYCSLFEYAPPIGKDGFLATNSLLAVFTLLIRAYGTEREQLPETVDELLGAHDLTAFLELTAEGDLERFVERDTLIVLYGSSTKTAAIDLESKLTEAALARVQLADFRNFAHGRHHWLAKRAEESAVLALCTPEDRDLCRRTLALLPREVPQLIAEFPKNSSTTFLLSLLFAFGITELFGRARHIDPGRPSVPEFGRKLYHLRTRRPQKERDIRSIAIRRKLRAGNVPPDFVDEKFWNDCFDAQLARLQNGAFSAVVFDYDGTLCSARRRLEGPAPEIVNQLKRLLRCGIGIGVATGRGRSVRHDLQKCLPKEHWESLVIGYYNSSDVGFLADDCAPCRSEVLTAPLQAVYEILRADKILRENCKWTLRPQQITLEPRSWLDGYYLWSRANERLQLVHSTDVRAVSSTHSIDIIGPGVVKTNLLKVLQSSRHLSASDRILCIGDRGRWPGNDCDLLAHQFSLSVDEVSSDPSTGWNLAPAGCRGSEATLYYMGCLKQGPKEVRLDFAERGA